MKKFIGILLFLFLLSPLFGDDYFVKNGGNDGLDGLSDANAWETWGKVRGITYSAGDTISFKRGDTWDVTYDLNWIIDDAGSEGSYITVGAYGEGTKPIINLEEELVGTGNWSGSGEANSTIAALDDDYFCRTVDEVWNTSLYRGCLTTNKYYQAGLRFQLDIPQGATITAATITVYVNSDSDTVYSKIYAHDVDNSPQITDFATWETAQASKTTANVDWDMAAPGIGTQVSPDITDVVQEIVSRGSWSANNYIHFFINDDGTANSNVFILDRWGNDNPAKLYVTYTNGEGTNIWSKTIPSSVRRCRLDGVDSAMAPNAASIDGITYLWHWAGNVLSVYATENPDTAYTNIKIARINMAIQLKESYLKVENLRFLGGHQAAIYVYTTAVAGTKSYIEINDCDIWYGGQYGIELDSNAAGTGHTHVTIHGNDIDSKLNLISKAFDENEININDGIKINNLFTDSTIDRNTFRDFCHSLINMQPDAVDTDVKDNIIEHNTFTGTNSAYCRAFNIIGSESTSTGNIVRFNYENDMTVRNQLGGGDNYFYYNIISNKRKTEATDKTDISQGLSLEVYGSAVCKNNKVYNNVFYNCYNEGIRLYEPTPGDVKDNLIKNNIVMGCGEEGALQNIQIRLYGIGTGNDISTNDFHDADSSDVVYYAGTAETVAEADAGRTEFSNNLGLDPLMIDPANDDFRLLMASPCINAGTDVGLTRDYRGRSIRHAPDIGAYEDPTNVLFLTRLFKYLKERK